MHIVDDSLSIIANSGLVIFSLTQDSSLSSTLTTKEQEDKELKKTWIV